MANDRAVLSIDFELFSHTPAYRNATSSNSKSDIGIQPAQQLLDLLDYHEVEATFFVVSEVAQKFPNLLQKISLDHEIASHTHTHRHLSELDRETYLAELRQSRKILSDVTGASVYGFRAPSFDISDDHFTFLSDTGYQYDSSIVPSRSIPGWYGGKWKRSRPGSADQFQYGAPSDIDILPVSVAPYLRLPLTGTWLRFFGVRYAAFGMKLLAQQDMTPVLYVHPWEFADLPTVKGIPHRIYWRTGRWMWDALDYLLSQPFNFVSATKVLE